MSAGAASHGGYAGQAHAHGQGAYVEEVFGWFLWVVAMIFPMVAGLMRYTPARSLWHLRHRAIAVFLIGYLGLWIAFRVAPSVAADTLRTQTSPGTAALGFSAVLLWQFTPTKRRGIRRSHRTQPLAPTDCHADHDCLRYNWLVGGSCMVSCWALMLA